MFTRCHRSIIQTIPGVANVVRLGLGLKVIVTAVQSTSLNLIAQLRSHVHKMNPTATMTSRRMMLHLFPRRNQKLRGGSVVGVQMGHGPLMKRTEAKTIMMMTIAMLTMTRCLKTTIDFAFSF